MQKFELCAAVILLSPMHFVYGQAQNASTMEIVRIPSGHTDRTLALHHVTPIGAESREGPVALFVHGATFPTMLASGFRIDGRSWMENLAGAGFDVWGLDFLGFGASDNYEAMDQREMHAAPLGRVDDAVQQLRRAVAEIADRQRANRVSLVAHSWGTLVAGKLAAEHPAYLDRLVLFGPVTARHQPPRDAAGEAYYYVTSADQENRFLGYVPEGRAQVFRAEDLSAWLPDYLATDPASATRVPPSVQVPAGPSEDVYAAWSGKLAYDPSEIRAPVLIVRGEWDSVTRDSDARWLFNALGNAPSKRDVVIDRGTHVMHLESGRIQLQREVESFLLGNDGSEDRAVVRLSNANEQTTHTSYEAPTSSPIPGYDYDRHDLPTSPVTLSELRQLEATIGLTEIDDHYLSVACPYLGTRAEDMVDAWRQRIANLPHLSTWSSSGDAEADNAYRAAVKQRFVRWVSDSCARPRDQQWLNYQHEIGLRHTPARKNQTDGSLSPGLVPLRYIITFANVVSTSARPVLEESVLPADEIAHMETAWRKVVLLQIALWSHSYARDGLW